MQLVSYRGPTEQGGVSNALTQIDQLQNQSSNWFYIVDDQLWIKRNETKKAVYRFDKLIQQNHYRYCNNFLWPIFHDMPELAKYSLVERLHYKVFNSSLALNLKRPEHVANEAYFVNDYQLALVPKFLSVSQNKYIFWHIPWPKNVLPQHEEALCEIAEALLQADVIGFHLDEYKENFERFINAHFSGQRFNTSLIVSPLGIDSRFWQDNAAEIVEVLPELNGLPYILSVDRVDYTKGVRERLLAIDHFFKCNPDWISKIVFVQQCQRSRDGLIEFDKYWNECRSLYQSINAIYAKDGWRPIFWTESPNSPKELASVYANAEIMLVNPIRDGLNLTAKEFIASQQLHPGVLALSKGAGVFSELGNYCLSVKPAQVNSFAYNILYGLQMSEQEKRKRHRLLKNCVVANSLSSWWKKFLDIENKVTSGKNLDKIERICG
ncbi:MAG: trehalose-6-phosphate synthase [Cyanobacteria bacterium TGS_CYA1]|nr:trehalose-6-phosphate synthase [Cyanobacteria bacterium TGS_CYA1]